MYFSNEFLYDFKPVYEGILAAKSVKPECAIVEVIDEEPDGAGMFEPAGTLDVLIVVYANFDMYSPVYMGS